MSSGHNIPAIARQKQRIVAVTAVLLLVLIGTVPLPDNNVLAAGFTLTIPTAPPLDFAQSNLDIWLNVCSLTCWGMPAAGDYQIYITPQTTADNYLSDASQGLPALTIPIGQIAVFNILDDGTSQGVTTNVPLPIQNYGANTVFFQPNMRNHEYISFNTHFRLTLTGDEAAGVYTATIVVTAVKIS